MIEKITKLLMEHFQAFRVVVDDKSHEHKGHRGVDKVGDTHFDVLVISNHFTNQPLISRHKAIYSVLDEPLKMGVHALKIKAYTKDEWEKRNG